MLVTNQKISLVDSLVENYWIGQGPNQIKTQSTNPNNINLGGSSWPTTSLSKMLRRLVLLVVLLSLIHTPIKPTCSDVKLGITISPIYISNVLVILNLIT